MLIQVEYLDGDSDFVDGSILTALIESRLITKFERADGWVDIDLPQVRKPGRPRKHKGPERRLH